jgi:D-alanyl-D-alanine carboxypeptidase/D-alanyl-D-alanine-endopeptidase (penicillin-binding protein 4)
MRSKCVVWLCLPLVFLMLAPVRASETMAHSLDHLLDVPGLAGGVIGAEVARVSDGTILYTHDADKRLTPASNRKLFTGTAALELLGKNYQIRTAVLAASGPDADGVLHGDVCLRGGGDGLISIADLDDLAVQVARTGVRHVTGGVCGDGTLFTDGPYGEGWEWDDLSAYYAPQISALEVHEGFVTVHVTAGAHAGDAPIVTEDPDVNYLPVADEAKTMAGTAPANLDISRPYDQNIAVVQGTLSPGETVAGDVSVVDPARFAAIAFRQALIQHGITVDNSAWSGPMPQATITLGVHLSVPMSQYLAKMDKPSDNLLAECLVRVLGAAKGTGGTYDAGLAASIPFYQRLGLKTDTLTLADGSGLSRKNLVTARAVTQLLVAMHGQPDWRAFYDSLPIGGVDGTLRSRMRGTAAAGNVHAKTGSLTGVRALSGYVTGHDGTLYAFSILLNNYSNSGTALIVRDAFAVWLAEHL